MYAEIFFPIMSRRRLDCFSGHLCLLCLVELGISWGRIAIAIIEHWCTFVTLFFAHGLLHIAQVLSDSIVIAIDLVLLIFIRCFVIDCDDSKRVWVELASRLVEPPRKSESFSQGLYRWRCNLLEKQRLSTARARGGRRQVTVSMIFVL